METSRKILKENHIGFAFSHKKKNTIRDQQTNMLTAIKMHHVGFINVHRASEEILYSHCLAFSLARHESANRLPGLSVVFYSQGDQ